MSFHAKLQKILMIKVQEKDQVMAQYNEALEEFEKAGTKLYELLKQKENMELAALEHLSSGTSIQHVMQNSRFLLNLEQSIRKHQEAVSDARIKMQGKENKLLEKNIEVKKFEKLKEKTIKKSYDEQIDAENKAMDEISIQQYMNRGN